MRNKMSPKNYLFSRGHYASFTMDLDGNWEYEALIKVKNKRGKGYRLRKVKVKGTLEEELFYLGSKDIDFA